MCQKKTNFCTHNLQHKTMVNPVINVPKYNFFLWILVMFFSLNCTTLTDDEKLHFEGRTRERKNGCSLEEVLRVTDAGMNRRRILIPPSRWPYDPFHTSPLLPHLPEMISLALKCLSCPREEHLQPQARDGMHVSACLPAIISVAGLGVYKYMNRWFTACWLKTSVEIIISRASVVPNAILEVHTSRMKWRQRLI